MASRANGKLGVANHPRIEGNGNQKMGRIWEGNGKFDCHFIDLAVTGQIDTREFLAKICNVVALCSPCVLSTFES
jgi:hypothetical protein